MRNTTAGFVLLTLALGLGSGAVNMWLYPGNPVPNSTIVFVIAYAFVAFLWVRSDSDKMGYYRSPIFTVAVVGASALAIPYYLLRTRGIKRGTLAVLLFVLLLIGNWAATAAGALAIRWLNA